ncbi:hypothetical protein ABW20_dc0101908 [Dactylellina cionopaga]|nr:hypothetical protein ABW20_dc0101908 [Dactylellina cionopaga]
MSSPTPSADTPKTYSCSPIADVVVECQDSMLLVSSTTLRVASPVWRKILDPDTEFSPLPTVTLDGKEYKKTVVNDIEAELLIVVFNIFHYNTATVPRTFEFSALRSIALVADEYDFGKALLPWTEFWVANLSRSPSHIDLLTTTGYEDWLFIATTFDVPDSLAIIQNVSKQLILEGVVQSKPEGSGKYPTLYRSVYQTGWNVIFKKQVLVKVKIDLIPQKILGNVSAL